MEKLPWFVGCLAFMSLMTPSRTDSTSYVQLEMYAVVTENDDPARPENLDMYDAAGLLKYLQTEVVIEHGKLASRQSRQVPGTEIPITKVYKYHIKVLNPAEKGTVAASEFSVFATFKNGQVQGDNATVEQFGKLGDLVGIGVYHPPSADPRWPLDETFYGFSFSGKCPNMADGHKDSSKCSTYAKSIDPDEAVVKGGLCPDPHGKGEVNPTGEPGCVYTAQANGSVDLDSLVGIHDVDCGGKPCQNWLDFRMHCTDTKLQFKADDGGTYCREYDFPSCPDFCHQADGSKCDADEVGTKFWTDRCNATRNKERADMVEKAFGGSDEDSHYATNPPCDQYPECNRPIIDKGLAFCHRDHKGVCDVCYVPGTVDAINPGHQVKCRIDLFKGKLKQYQDAVPSCKSSCDSKCSLDTDDDRCCLMTGKCKREWEVGNWSECDATCGKGNKTRTIVCPFEDLFGTCKDSPPANRTSCRGDSCPWDKSNFSEAWGECSNGCGEGFQIRQPECDCPHPCTSDDCAKSPLPSTTPNRSCYVEEATTEFCGQCAEKNSTCEQCFTGFSLGNDGKCRNAARVAEAVYHLSANQSGALEKEEFINALVPAFELVLWSHAKSGLVKVKSVSKSKFDEVFLLRRLAVSSNGIDLAVVVLCEDDTDEALNATMNLLAHVDVDAVAADLPEAIGANGCNAEVNCTVPENLTVTLSGTPDSLCPELGKWDPSKGCPVAPVPTTTTAARTTTGGSDGSDGQPVWLTPVLCSVGAVIVVAALVGFCSKRRRDRMDDSDDEGDARTSMQRVQQ